MEMSELIKGTIQELIETLWNVNKHKKYYSKDS